MEEMVIKALDLLEDYLLSAINYLEKIK